MEPILITGGTGVLGRAVVRRLVDAGRPVRVLSRRAGRDHVVADLDTGDGLAAAVADAEVVVHLATTPRGGTEAAGTERLVAAAKHTRHLVFISIVGVDRVPIRYYRDKLAAERVIAESGLPHTILRTTQFHDLVRTIFAGAARLPVMPVPAVRAQPIDVRDVAARLADLALGEPRGRTSDLGGPEVRDLRELAREYLAATGRRRPLLPVKVPGSAFRAYRDGGHLAREHADGTITFAAYLAEHPTPKGLSYRGKP